MTEVQINAYVELLTIARAIGEDLYDLLKGHLGSTLNNDDLNAILVKAQAKADTDLDDIKTRLGLQ